MTAKTIQEAFASLSEPELRRIRTILAARIHDLDQKMEAAVPIGSFARCHESDLRYRNELSDSLNKLYDHRSPV